jgi:hypothetical protein
VTFRRRLVIVRGIGLLRSPFLLQADNAHNVKLGPAARVPAS